MKDRTLFAAFALAQTRVATAPALPAPPLPATQPDPGTARDRMLVNALRNSATDRDQIMQRRINMINETSGAD